MPRLRSLRIGLRVRNGKAILRKPVRIDDVGSMPGLYGATAGALSQAKEHALLALPADPKILMALQGPGRHLRARDRTGAAPICIVDCIKPY